MIIIHISGSPGSGKTTIGNKLKQHFKAKVVVKDLDDLFSEYMEAYTTKFNPIKYQKFIDNFIENNRKKSIIFVGLNGEHLTKTFYDIHADYKFFIDLPTEINLQRHFNRELNSWLNWMENRDRAILFNQLLDDEKEVINDLTNSLKRVLSISKQEKFIISFYKIYEKEKYEFMTSTRIFNKVLKLLE